MNFVRINNLKNLLLKDIPTYHPESRKYLSYWREQKRRCIEGMWSVDDEEYHVEDLSTFDPYKCDYTGNKWRFITPNLYFYGNFGTILHSPKGAAKTSPKIRLRPSIRDVEWEVFYDVLEFRGFSGFELDEEYTCCEDLLDKDLLEDDYDISCFNSSGKLKTYVKPFDYLRGLKDKPLGKPLYRNGAKNYMLLATRELGKSFLVGGGIILHDLLMDGQKDYGGNIPVSEIFVGSALASKSFDLLKKVKLGMDNLPGTHGKGSKFETPSPLFKQMSGSIRPNNKWTHSYEKKVGGSWKTYGSGSNITHIPVTSENPEAAAGGRYSYVIIEEVGLCFSPETEVRMYDLSIKKIKDINVGDFVMGSSGNAEEVINTMSGKEEMFKISQTFGDDYTVSKNHIMYLNDRYKSNKLINPRKCLVQDVDNLCKSNRREIYGISNECLIFKKNNDILEVEPYFLGIWIGDGDCNSPSISAHDNSKELIDYIYEYSERLGMYVSKYETSYKCHRYGIIRQFGGNRIHKKDTVNNPNYLSQSLRNLGIFSNKRIPTKYQKASVKDRLDLLAGLLDTDGCIVTKKTEEHFEFYQTNRKDLVEDVRLLAKNLGFRTRVSIRRINTGYAGKILPEYRDKYVVRISGDINKIPVKIGYKKAPKREFKKHINSNSIKIESIGTGNYNGITLKNNPLFLLKDGTIVHNCPNIIQVHGSNTAAMQQGTHQMGSSVYIGTGGNVTKVVQSEEIFRHPSNYNMLEFEDEWENTGKICRFIPAYYKDNEFKDINGNTNVEKAIKHYEKRRERASNNSNTRALYAEMMNYPLKPSDMFLSEIGGIFPTADLKTIYGNVSTDKKTLDSHLRVELRIDALGKVFMETSKKPIIRDYPISVLKVDTDTAIEIYELPSKDSNDNIVSNRYSIGCLPKGEVVLTSKGLKKVEEVKLTDKLVNGEGNNVDIKLLLNHNVVNEDCYEIKMSNTYRTTTFTKEHPILISDKKLGYVSKDKYKRLGIKQRYYKFNFNFVKAEEIKKGQWIQFPNLYSNIKAIDLSKWKSTDNPLNKKDFWWFIGLWLGDGWTSINGRSIGVVFNSNEEYYINRYLDVITNVFNRTFSKRCRGNCVEIQFNFPQLVKFLDTNFNKKALNKNIPEWVKFIDVEFKKQMMLGYLASDGCVYKDTKGYYLTEFVSISLPLLEGFQDILTSLRIISSITKLRDAKQAKILGRVCNTKKTYHLRVSHNDSINLALLLGDKEDLKLSRIDFNNLPKVIKHPVIGCFISEDKKYIYYRIEDITKKSYTGVVYNYHCDTNIYTCRAITCHNCDPVDDDDKYRDSSLLSSIVMDTWTDRIVAEYTGKPPLVNNYYEQLRRLAMFYNAKILYEKNKKGLFTYLDNKNGIYLLEETPKFLGDIMDIKFSSIGNQKYGVTTGNKVIIKHCEDLVNDYLVQQAYDKPEGVLNMHTIKSPAILKELYMYNRDMNTDRVSAMFMVILARQSRLKFIDTSRNSTKRIMSSNDPFWNNAYNRNNKNMIKILH